MDHVGDNLLKNLMDNYEEKQYHGYILKNSVGKTENMICVMSRISLQKPQWEILEIWYKVLPHQKNLRDLSLPMILANH